MPHVAVRSCQGTELALKHPHGTVLCLARHLQDQDAGPAAFRTKTTHLSKPWLRAASGEDEGALGQGASSRSHIVPKCM